MENSISYLGLFLLGFLVCAFGFLPARNCAFYGEISNQETKYSFFDEACYVRDSKTGQLFDAKTHYKQMILRQR